MIKTRLLLALSVIGLIVVSGVIFFSYRMYQADIDKLVSFETAYRLYDRNITDYSTQVLTANHKKKAVAAEEKKAYESLAALRIAASVRISSLIKNDGEAMRSMQKISVISNKEFEVLEQYKNAATNENADLSELAKSVRDLANQRQASFAYFMELGGGRE
jgi:hypothetical protein